MWQWNPEGIPLKMVNGGFRQTVIVCQRVGLPAFVHIWHEIVDQRNWELAGNQHWNPCDPCDLYASSRRGPPWRDHLFIWQPDSYPKTDPWCWYISMEHHIYHTWIRHGYGWWHDPSPFQDSHLGTRSEIRHHILCNASGPWARSTCSNFFGPLGQSRNGKTMEF